MPKPKISLVIVNKGYDIFLEKLFKSLKAQTFQDFEVIFVEFGNNDSNKGLVQRYFSKSTFYLKDFSDMKGSEVQRARAFGVEKINEKYGCIVEVDAVYKPNFLEKMYNELYKASDEVGFVYCSFYYMRNNLRRECNVPEFDRTNIKSWSMPMLFKSKYMLNEFFPFHVLKLQDWFVWLSLYKRFKKIGKKVNFFGWTHMQPNTSNLKSISWRRINEHKKWKEYLIKKFPGIIK